MKARAARNWLVRQIAGDCDDIGVQLVHRADQWAHQLGSIPPEV